MADQKVLICQVKAFFWLIFLLLSFFPCLAVCTILWIFSGPKEAKSNPNIKKKTVLVTGAPLTKGKYNSLIAICFAYCLHWFKKIGLQRKISLNSTTPLFKKNESIIMTATGFHK